MLIRTSKSLHYSGLFAAGLLVVVLALFIFAPAAHAGEPTCPNWVGNYWNNTTLSGQQTLVRCDQAIDFDWHGLSPDPSINVDNFSAGWVRTYNFAPGTYRFRATMDDGMRVYIDRHLIIDSWQEGNVRTIEVDVNLSSGPHQIVVEYFEKGGNAVAGFTWSALDGQPMPPQPQPPSHPMPPAKPMPPPANVDYPVAEVKASYLNVRSGGGVEFPVVGVLQKNAKVDLLGRDMGGKWVLIKSGGLVGWVNRYYLHTTFPYTSLPFVDGPGGQPVKPEQPIHKYDAVVNTGSLNVRSGPGAQYRAIAVVHGGQGVNVVSKNPNGWVQIQIPGSVTGWVNGYYLTYP
jgi:uncharacterized protein YraI